MGTRVYILGAGASAAACGLPVTREVLPRAILNAQSPYGDKTYQADLALVLKEIQYPDVLDPDTRPSRNFLTLWPTPNFEELLGRYQRDGLKQEEEALKRVLYSVLGGRDYDGPGSYRELVELIESSTDEPTAIITFNYDLNLDRAWARRASVHDIPWTHSVHFASGVSDEFPSYERLSHSPPALHLLKLHGSFGFLRCPRCGSLGLEYYVDYRPERGFASVCKRCGNMHSFSPVLLAPVHDKRPPAELNTAWKVAHDFLSRCDSLTLIGYSLPDQDEHVRRMLSEALGSTSGKSQLTVVDTSAESRHKLIGLLGGFFSRTQAFESLDGFLSRSSARRDK